MECQWTTGSGAAPASISAADMSASPLEVGWPGSHVREDHGEVSPLSREGIWSTGDSPSIHPITEWHLLVPRSHPRCLRGSSYEALSLTCLVCQAGKTTGLPRSADFPGWVRSCLYAGGSSSAPQEFGACGPGHSPFGPSVTAACACSRVTAPATLHLG